MLNDLKFEINSRLEVSWNDGYYKSSVENVEEDFLGISIPVKDGQYIPLRPGEKIEVIYYDSSDIFRFNTSVVGRRKDNIPVILLAYPKEIFKVQRRRFVRVPIVCAIEYSKIENNPASKTLNAVMIDLSGGGMKIKLRDKISIGDRIKAIIPLAGEKIPLKGEIVRVEYEEDTKRNISGVSFIDLDEKTREKLIRFIFQVMRDQMKKAH